MEHELTSPTDLAPPSVSHLPSDQRIELWTQLVDECETLLIVGMKVKPVLGK